MKKLLLLLLTVALLSSCEEVTVLGSVVQKNYYKPYTTTSFIRVGSGPSIPRVHHHSERYEIIIHNSEINKGVRRTVSQSQYEIINIGDSVYFTYTKFK